MAKMTATRVDRFEKILKITGELLDREAMNRLYLRLCWLEAAAERWKLADGHRKLYWASRRRVLRKR